MIGDVLARIGAIFQKEFVQMRRDRITFAMMLSIPVMQLTLFGFAINMDPKHLPTALHLEETTPIVRSIVSALQVSGYYEIVMETDDPREASDLLARGDRALHWRRPARRRVVRDKRGAAREEQADAGQLARIGGHGVAGRAERGARRGDRSGHMG